MDGLLIKLFALALAMSQVSTTADSVKTSFDPSRDQTQVISLLGAGCEHLAQTFGLEALNIDDLVQTALQDPEAITGGQSAFRGLNFNDLERAYRGFCKNDVEARSSFRIDEVIRFYNMSLTDLPSTEQLRNMRGTGASELLDARGLRFAELGPPERKRLWVSLSEVPVYVQQAFIAAEDKEFYNHRGIDERGLVRAFIANFAQAGRPQGGSTITQQLVKNVLVGAEVSYERKIREMISTAIVERELSKDDILELYLNTVYIGRGAWGVEMAARNYFGKAAKELSFLEGATLAALVKGPTFYNPDRHPERALQRLKYVVDRMQENGFVSANDDKTAVTLPKLISRNEQRRETGFHYTDQVVREAKALAGIDTLGSGSYTVQSTVIPELQLSVEKALQEGLARFEIESGRQAFDRPEGNLREAIERLELERKPSTEPMWLQALRRARSPLYDVHWPLAVVLPKGGSREALRVGLADGRTISLAGRSSLLRALRPFDLVFVKPEEGKSKSARAELRVRPQVQGTAVVMENRRGRVLAMAGSFSYPLSQLNRATQAVRQPGSAIKPITYLAALQAGLQPNTLVRDEPITLPAIGTADKGKDWTPKNYDGSSSGVITLREALQRSRNLATVRLLDGGIDKDPAKSLNRVCELALEARLYKKCEPYYPFVLGAEPIRPIDLASLFATIANEGERPLPYTIETITRDGHMIYQHSDSSYEMSSVDASSMYQMKTLLQGVLKSGTASAIKELAPYVAGKTGTSDDENDAWIVGFTNEVTIAVWVGYDNADGKRRTLGGGSTGGTTAVPIFEPIVRATWAYYSPRTPLAPPSTRALDQLIASKPGRDNGGEGLPEYVRKDSKGRPVDARYRLVSRAEHGPEGGEGQRNPKRKRVVTTTPQQPFSGGWQDRSNWSGDWSSSGARSFAQPQQFNSGFWQRW